MMPEKEAYDIARKRGVWDDEIQLDSDDGGDKDDARESLGSSKGEFSLASWSLA